MWKELTVSEWREELDRALRFRKQYGLEEHWPQLRNMFYNTHDSQMSASPNIVLSMGDSLLSNLIVPSPQFGVKALHPLCVATSPVVESVDNMLVRAMKMKPAMQRSCLSAYAFGRGILKLGYDSEYGYNDRFDPGMKGDEEGYTLTQFDRRGRRIEFGRANPGMPWMDSVLPQDFLVPWGTIELDTAPWCAHRVVRHIDDVKADQKYENTRDIRPVMTMEDMTKSYSRVTQPYRYRSSRFRDRSDISGNPEYCELWEIHDRRTGKIFVIATGHDEFLRNDIDLMQIYGQLPFVSFSFIPSLDSFWVTPDVHYLKPHQAELTDIAIQSTKQRRLSVLRFMAKRGAITEDELVKLLSADVGAVAWIEEGAEFDIDKVLKQIQPGTNQQLHIEAEYTRSNAKEQMGFSSNQQGNYESSGRRSATEASIVSQASNVRNGRRQSSLADTYEEVIIKTNGAIFKYWKRPQLLNFTDRDGVEKWNAFTGEMLDGDYQYSVQLVNQTDDTPAQKKQQALQMFPTLSQDPAVDPVKLRQWMARQINDPNFLSIYKTGVLTAEGAPNAPVQLPVQGQQLQPSGGQVPSDVQGQ